MQQDAKDDPARDQLALCAGAVTLLAACGSGTKTVTVASVPPVTQTTATRTQPSTTKTTGTTTTPTQTTHDGQGTRRPRARRPSRRSRRTKPKPKGPARPRRSCAQRGYTPNDTSDYHSDQALRVLVGTRTGSADGYGQQAFFFVNGRYIGTDTKQPSATVKVVSSADTEVTLGYPLYRKSDPLSSPSGGEARVTLPAEQRQARRRSARSRPLNPRRA